MVRLIKKLAVPFAAAAMLSVGACGDAEDAADEVQELFDCSAICSAFELCVEDDGFDTTECIDRCEENADASDLFEEQAEDCTDCVDTDACDEGVWQCEGICDGIVP